MISISVWNWRLHWRDFLIPALVTPTDFSKWKLRVLLFFLLYRVYQNIFTKLCDGFITLKQDGSRNLSTMCGSIWNGLPIKDQTGACVYRSKPKTFWTLFYEFLLWGTRMTFWSQVYRDALHCFWFKRLFWSWN